MFPALLLALLQAAPAPAAPAELYAALPLRNLTADGAAPGELAGRLRQALELRGARFVPAERIEALLVARRIRSTDSISVEDARALRGETGAAHVITGTLLEFRRGSRPSIALSLRVIDAASGGREQSLVLSLRGEDSRGWLGLGAVEDAGELSERVVARLLGLFGPDAAPLPLPARGTRTPELDDGPIRPRPRPRFELSGVERVAVLPFVNRSTRPEASVQFAEVLADEWFRSARIQVVESSELRAALVRERIRYLSDLDPQALAAVGRALGVRHFVLGSLDRYGEEETVADKHYPVVEATLRLVDAESGLVVASTGLRVRGDAHRQPLGFGLVHDPLVVAAEVARGLISQIGG